jgi:hypothetical protein
MKSSESFGINYLEVDAFFELVDCEDVPWPDLELVLGEDLAIVGIVEALIHSGLHRTQFERFEDLKKLSYSIYVHWQTTI